MGYIYFFLDVEPRDFGVENPMCGPKSYMFNFFLDFSFNLFFDCSTNPTLAVWEKKARGGTEEVADLPLVRVKRQPAQVEVACVNSRHSFHSWDQ